MYEDMGSGYTYIYIFLMSALAGHGWTGSYPGPRYLLARRLCGYPESVRRHGEEKFLALPELEL
jgi:hypothetical protein